MDKGGCLIFMLRLVLVFCYTLNIVEKDVKKGNSKEIIIN